MIRAHYRSPPFLIPKSFLAVYNVEKGFLMTWAKLLSLLFLVAPLMLLVGCDGGSQPLDTPTPGGEAIAKVEAEPSSAEEPSKPELTETPNPTTASPKATVTTKATELPTPAPNPTKAPSKAKVTTKAAELPTHPTQVQPKTTPTPMSTPTIVGTVNFQVDVQQVTTVSELGQASIVGPSLIRLRDGRYRLYLQARAYGSDNNADGVNIVSLISTDGIQWDVEPGTRISHGSESDVDSEAGEPGVYLGLDGKYYMAYTGRYIGANPDGVNQKMHRVVFAVSDDGLNWTKLNQHYTGSYDDAWTGFASSADVHIVNGQYVIYYTSGRKIIRAASQDGLIWVRQEIAIAAGHDSTMVEYDGVYYMFVMMPEGLEYERNPDTTRDNLVMAISQDGVNWSKDYYQVIVENGDGSQVAAVDLQDPGAILLSDGSLRIFLNNDRGKGIYSIKPTTALPKLVPYSQ